MRVSNRELPKPVQTSTSFRTISGYNYYTTQTPHVIPPAYCDLIKPNYKRYPQRLLEGRRRVTRRVKLLSAYVAVRTRQNTYIALPRRQQLNVESFH